VRQRIDDSGMSPEEIRRRSRTRVDPDALNEYLPGGSKDRAAARRRIGQCSAAAPSGALTAPLEPLPSRSRAKAKDPPRGLARIHEGDRKKGPHERSVLPFGYEIFGYLPATFEPLAAGPVDPDYPIGPGDEVVVRYGVTISSPTRL